MKKIIYTIITLIFFATINMSAQLTPVPFLPDEAIEDAKNYAETEIETEINNAVLVGIGSADMTIDEFPGGIEIKYDHKTGKSGAWGYMIMDADDPSKRTTIGAVKLPFVGLYFMELSAGDFNVPFAPQTSLETFNWINSDRLMKVLEQNLEYSDYITEQGEVTTMFVALVVNNVWDDLKIGDPYWILAIGPEGNLEPDLTFYVNALDEEVTVFDFRTSLPMVHNDLLKVFPIPATDKINVQFDNEIINVKNVLVINSGGVSVDATNSIDLNANGFVLPVNDFATGSYFILVRTADNLYIRKFIKN